MSEALLAARTENCSILECGRLRHGGDILGKIKGGKNHQPCCDKIPMIAWTPRHTHRHSTRSESLEDSLPDICCFCKSFDDSLHCLPRHWVESDGPYVCTTCTCRKQFVTNVNWPIFLACGKHCRRQVWSRSWTQSHLKILRQLQCPSTSDFRLSFPCLASRSKPQDSSIRWQFAIPCQSAWPAWWLIPVQGKRKAPSPIDFCATMVLRYSPSIDCKCNEMRTVFRRSIFLSFPIKVPFCLMKSKERPCILTWGSLCLPEKVSFFGQLLNGIWGEVSFAIQQMLLQILLVCFWNKSAI